MNDSQRSIEREIFIYAEPDRVWRAITEAEEIVNWFALEAESEPDVGGYIGLSWGLKAVEPDRCHIVEWDPGARLVMTWRDAPGGEHELPVEISLERRGGGTLLRLVHSGFLSDESWDEEYEAHGRGWSYELRSLKFYLERQPNRTRRHVLARFPLEGDRATAWRRVVGPSGAFGAAGETLAEGDQFLLTLPDGTTSPAELLYAFDGRDFVAAAEILRNGLFRIALEVLSDRPEIWIWAFSWEMSSAELRKVVQPIHEAVGARLRKAMERREGRPAPSGRHSASPPKA
jgi:uncharacterized protein YndB with AHSA1/START domain